MDNNALQALVVELESYLPALETKRTSDPLANDCFEAADYWCGLGRRVLEGDTRVNYPERVRGEHELLDELREISRRRPSDDLREFERVLEAGKELLEIVGAVKPPHDGHLGFLRIIRELFGFVLTEFAFKVTDEQPTSIRLSSGAVYLDIECLSDPWLSFSFGLESPKPHDFRIHDLLLPEKR
ncbi:MAG TPA: hypothetical protein VGG56_08500 [Terracidiphilus sp.]|jgi:hypothetical protein